MNLALQKKGEKTKTKSVIDILNKPDYIRAPLTVLLDKTKLEVKAIIMGRYGMLDCSNNYEVKYKRKNCMQCNEIDNESHRINSCPKWKNINFYDSDIKVDFLDIYSSDSDMLSKMAGVVLGIWDLANGKNEMRNNCI